MSSRRDQVDAQKYMLNRVTGAMVRADPETAELPTRRDRTGTIGGAVLGVLLLGVVAVWALLPGSGSTRWQEPRTLLVDSATGARYLLASGRLLPVDDVATATLLAGGPLAPTVVAPSKLAEFARGPSVGTPDGPQALPSSARLNGGVWRACARGATRIGLEVDVPASRRALDDHEAVVVAAAGTAYLLWAGRRWRLAEDWVVDVLGLGLQVPVQVGRSWLELVPPAGTAGPLSVRGRDRPGPAVAGRVTSIGALFRVDLGNGSAAHYLATGDGLAPLTDTEYLLEKARPGSPPETTITSAELAVAARNTSSGAMSGLPATPPTPASVPAGTSVCVEYTGSPDRDPRFVVAKTPSGPAENGATGVEVRVPPGGGAVLLPRPDADPDQQRGVLVDERGVAYPIAGRDIATLGYARERIVAMPPALVSLLATGPALSRPEGG